MLENSPSNVAAVVQPCGGRSPVAIVIDVSGHRAGPRRIGGLSLNFRTLRTLNNAVDAASLPRTELKYDFTQRPQTHRSPAAYATQ